MKSLFLLAGIGAMAVMVTIGAAQIQASPSTVVDFCPPEGAANCSTAATMLVSSSKPSDDVLIADINQIVTAARAHHLTDAACRDTEAGLATLAAAIRDTAVAGLAQKLAISACGSNFQTATAGLSPAPFAGGTSGDGNSRPISSSSGSSGTNGNSSSGASGGSSSGSSGNSSSGTGSGTSTGNPPPGCLGDGCGSSSGTGASSGSTGGGQSSSGAGTSGSTSGDQSSSGAGTSSGATGGQSSSGAGTSGSTSGDPNGCENGDCGGGIPDVN